MLTYTSSILFSHFCSSSPRAWACYGSSNSFLYNWWHIGLWQEWSSILFFHFFSESKYSGKLQIWTCYYLVSIQLFDNFKVFSIFLNLWIVLHQHVVFNFNHLKKHDVHTYSFFWLQKEFPEQWALACGEILRVLTHYNRPIYKTEVQNSEIERSSSGSQATTSDAHEGEACQSMVQEHDRKPLRPLTPWITDILLAAPLGIRSDYFRWCAAHFFFFCFTVESLKSR